MPTYEFETSGNSASLEVAIEMARQSIDRHQASLLPDQAAVQSDCRSRRPDELADSTCQCSSRGIRIAAGEAVSTPNGKDEPAVFPEGTYAGRFQLIRELGRGGFGVVLLAFDPQLKREVALKLPLPERLVDPNWRKRIIREARAAASLDHPGILPVLETGTIRTIHYIATAYCDGPDLDKWVSAQGRVPIKLACELVADVADAVQHAHSRGILHRDIKPANILLKLKDGTADLAKPIPLLTDFGLSRPALSNGELEVPGAVGTPAYMAPEVASGSAENGGVFADVYSLGAVLHELICGSPPNASQVGSAPPTQVNDRVSDAHDRRSSPRDLVAILERALHEQPEKRYQSSAALANDLRAFIAGRPVAARPIGKVEWLTKWCRRDPWLATSLGVLLVTVVASIPTVSWLYLRERGARTLAVQRGATMREILADMSGTLADDRLTNVPGMDETRIALLKRSVAVYRQLARDQKYEEQSLHDLSVALHRFANAHAQTGRAAEARALRMECLAIVEKLRVIDPANEKYQYDEFMNLLLLGTEWRGTDLSRAATITKRAFHVIRSLVAKHPENEIYLDALAAVACDVASDLWAAGHTEEARAVLVDAARRSRELSAAYPDRPLYLKHAVLALEQLGNLATQQRDLAAARQRLGEAWEALEIVQRSLPNDRSLRSQRGNILLKMATVSLLQGDVDEADRKFREAKETWLALARDYPDAIQIGEWIAEAAHSHALCLLKANRTEEAMEHYTDAVVRLEELSDRHPHIESFRQRLERFRKNNPFTLKPIGPR